jgi:hypothetical protein
MNTMNTSTVRIERTWVNIDDDCFSPKPNSSDLYVNTMYCNGTHGQVSHSRSYKLITLTMKVYRVSRTIQGRGFQCL